MKRQFSIVKQRGVAVMDESAATQTIAFIGRKRSGKSYASGVMAEHLYKMGDQLIIIDPTGRWPSLRLGKDGKSPGLPIFVLGGKNGDMPLSPESGAVVAKFLIEKQVSAVLDVSQMKTSVRQRFMAAFLVELFDSVKERDNGVCTLFLDEAHLFAEQQPRSSYDKQCLDAVDDITRLGGNFGIGVVFMTQNPQSMAKSVLNQVECLFVGQLNGAHERKAIKNWIVAKQTEEDLNNYVDQLPSLQRGEFFIWSPSWLQVFAKVDIKEKETFDGSATPRLGEKTKPLKLSKVDLKQLGESLQETVAEIEANNPQLLKAQIAQLQRELKELKSRPPPKPEVDPAFFEQLQIAVGESRKAIGMMNDTIKTMNAVHGIYQGLSDKSRKLKSIRIPAPIPEPVNARTVTPKAVKVTHVEDESSDPRLRKVHMTILGVMKEFGKPMDLGQIAILSGYSKKSSGPTSAIADLRKWHMITGSGKLELTNLGLQSAPAHTPPLPSKESLLEYWKQKLKGAPATVLGALYNARPESITFEEILNKTGYSTTSSGPTSALAELCKLELIEVSKENGVKTYRIADAFL